MSKHMSQVFVVCLMPCAALAQQENNVICQHDSFYEPPGYYYEINPNARTVTIHHGVPGYTFDFEAVLYDENWQYVGPGDINSITADTNAGVVVITILAQQYNQTYGARDVKHINLGATGVTGAISSIYLAGSLGVDGNTEADSAINTWRVEAGIYHDIVVEQFDGTITCPELNGDLYAWGEGPHTGHLDLWHGRVHSIHLNGSLEYPGGIEAGGGLDGTIHVGSGLGIRWVPAP